MHIYLVGGAVRDTLLNRKVTERDYVVVGATVEDMLKKGFTQVGKDFPVFLHPTTKEEYALARIERKKGRGYTGFECDASASVSLEQDLMRRDLTVNAMAMDDAGNIIDPFNGQKDLKNRILRHVSDAFVEDPLRVLRVARFASRYFDLGFYIHSSTLNLMRQINQRRELEYLSAPRVWQETAKSLMQSHPDVFFTTLKSIDALRYWFTELDKLWGVPNPSAWHPEIDTGLHTMMVLQQTALSDLSLPQRYAALTHDLGKALTDVTQWPSHLGHDELGIAAIEQFSKRLLVPNDCKDLAILVSRYHSIVHRVLEKPAKDVLGVFEGSDAFRRPQRFEQMLEVCKCDYLGRKRFAHKAYPQATHWHKMFEALQKIDVKQWVEKGFKGPQIKDALHRARIKVIEDYLHRHAGDN